VTVTATPPFCPHFAVALTGGIASGKTVVSQQWGALGVRILDTDAIAHALTLPNGAAIAAISAEFGASMIQANGAMDRVAMRALVFSDPVARKALEAILHPMIQREVRVQGSAALLPSEAYVVFVVPLLVGLDGDASRWRTRVQRIATVDCAPELQIVRLMARSGLDFAAAQAMIAAQASRAQRLHCADDVLGNDADLAALSQQAARLHEKYTHLAATFAARAPQAQGEALN
jgi:dephospho-CoA kinase